MTKVRHPADFFSIFGLEWLITVCSRNQKWVSVKFNFNILFFKFAFDVKRFRLCEKLFVCLSEIELMMGVNDLGDLYMCSHLMIELGALHNFDSETDI